jgi:exonuclease VII small subunit
MMMQDSVQLKTRAMQTVELVLNQVQPMQAMAATMKHKAEKALNQVQQLVDKV